MIRRLSAALTLLAAPAALAAQAHPLVGAWNITYPGGMRIENGTPTPQHWTGVLTIEATGDSLIGTLVTDSTETQRRSTQRFATKAVTSGDVTFQQQQQARLNMNGEERTAVSWITWIFKVNGDAFEGSMERSIEGVQMTMGGPQPVKGTRRKA